MKLKKLSLVSALVAFACISVSGSSRGAPTAGGLERIDFGGPGEPAPATISPEYRLKLRERARSQIINETDVLTNVTGESGLVRTDFGGEFRRNFDETPNSFVNVIGVGPQSDATFPEIIGTATITSLAAINEELTIDNFTVYEGGCDGGTEQTLLFAEPISTGTASVADILFVFDDTGSMGEEINAMKAEATSFANAVESAGIDARFGLVSFKDEAEVDLAFTSSAAAFQNAVDLLSPSGGGSGEINVPEAGLDGIMLGLNTLSFRPTAQKIIVLITDAPVHYRGDGRGISAFTIPEVVDALQSNAVTFFAVSKDRGQTDTNADPFFLTQGTGSIWLDIESTDFTTILNSILQTVTTSWRFGYITTNPARDGTVREVCLVIDDPDEGVGQDTGTYVAPLFEDSFVNVLTVQPDPEDGFPTITGTVFIDTERGRNGDYVIDDVEAREDGVPQTLIEWTPIGLSSLNVVDIVFLFDDTSSMEEEIGTMKQEAIAFGNAVAAAGLDARFALLSFKDNAEIDLGLTESISQFSLAVSQLRARFGDDDPEASLNALNLALEDLDFRPTAAKIFVLITDNLVHYRGDGTPFSDETIPEVVQALQDASVTLFVASSDLGRTNTNADPFFLAQGVGGVWFDILSADFSAVLQSILDTVITSWRFTYITTNPECDGTQRITEIIITDPDVGVAGDFSTYVAPDDCDDPDPDPDPDYGPGIFSDYLLLPNGWIYTGDAETQDNEWFGFVNVNDYPWVWTNCNGWMYVGGGYWFYIAPRN